MLKPLLSLLLAALLLATSPAGADYRTHPKAAEFMTRLEAAGFSRAELQTLLASANRNPKLIQAEQQSAEKTKTWPEYLQIFLQPGRIEAGVAFWREHAATLERTRRQFGVPPEVIVAIIGVETRYGGYTGPHRILDSLSTQGFEHPTRSPFFFNELIEFVLACRDFGLDPLTVQGSYAGAMGLSQFMPSNYRRLALDFDQNGRTDLWSAQDAIGSTANYLINYRGPGKGWQADQPVVVAALGTPAASDALNPTKPNSVYGDFSRRLTAIPAIPVHEPAGLIALEGEHGTEYWFGLTNFYNLMAYNPRVYYAMAVYRLSRAIADRMATDTGVDMAKSR